MWFLTCFNSDFFLTSIKSCRKDLPMFFATGTSDQFTDIHAFRDFILLLENDYQLKNIKTCVIEQADHFFRLRIDGDALAKGIQQFIKAII